MKRPITHNRTTHARKRAANHRKIPIFPPKEPYTSITEEPYISAKELCLHKRTQYSRQKIRES